ncbi:TPA: VCBS domain-containing protein [Aeromonas veronii]|nr:VCBS domain-containing protein [Aeromonas veronii]
MAKKPQPHELTPEQKAAQLKPREHQLGGAEVHTGDEIIIGWESTLNEASVSADASSPTTGQEPSHLSSHTIDDRQSESRLPVSGLKNVLESHAHHPVPPSSELSRPAGRLVDQPLVSGHDTTAFYGSVSADPKTAEVSPLSWQADATDSQPSGDIPSAISGTLSPQVLAAHDEQSPPTYFQLQGVVQGEVTEDQGVDAYGALTVTGHPSSDLLWYVASRQGVFGTLDIDQQGQWHYQLENSSSKVQALVTGQSMAESFVVLVADNTGVTHMTQLQIRVNGSNDLPVMAVVTPLDTHEGGLAVHGQLSATDLDAGDQLIFSAAHPVAGFVLHDDGQYVFDPSSPVYDHLKSGEQQILDIPVAVTDRQGAQDTRILRIILTGSNDVPALQIVEVRSAQEDVPPLHGQLLGTDPDRGDTLVYSTTLLVPGFSLHTDGSYSFDPSHASYQHLAAGQTRDVVIPIIVTDSVGASSTQNLTIKLTGSNDGATIAGVSSGSTSEDNTQAVTGQLTITDMDDGEAYFVAQSGVVGTYGTFTMNEQGQWRYQLDNRKPDVQSLKTGYQVTDSFTVHSADGTAHTVTVTITGTNDAPTVAHALTTTTAAEDAAFSFGIPKDTFADLDTGDTLTLSTGSLPAWLHFDAATGTFSGTPANGDVGTQHITVTATDGSGAQVSSTFDLVVSNTNDAPMLNSIASVRVTEDCAQATGQFTATDPDTGDTLIYSIAQPVDGLTVNADGSWSFDPAHASYQHLTAGQTQVLTIPMTVTDSAGATSTQDLVIKVNGTNDGAVIAGTDVGTVTEDQTAGGSHYLQATGTLSVTDVDAGEAVFRAGTSTGHYGDLVLHRDGQWMYQADNSIGAVQALKAGQQVTESFTVHSADGTTHTITVTVTGTNDSPTVTHVLTTRTATEDAAFSFGVPAGTFSDIDTGDALTLSTGALPAWLHFDATTGTFSGTPANGDVGTIPITVTAIDSSGAQVSTTCNLVVNNTNDAPMLSSIASVRVTEDGAQASGQFTATDPDTDDTLTYSISYAVDGFTLNANGSYIFDPSHASYQQLVAGQTQVLLIPVTVTDSAGATSTQNLSITVTGINEGAVVAGVDSASLREDVAVTAAGKLVATGQLSIVDPDAGQAHFVAQPATPGTYGVFSIDAAGAWHYEVNNARTEIQQLKAGETITDSMTATTMDGSMHQIQISITGANDVPVLTAQTQSLSEDGHLFAGQLHANDVDLGDTLQFSTSATVAGFTLNSDGTYQFDPANAAYQHVAAGQTQVLTIPVTVTDAAGATSTQNLSITVTGTNDGSIIAGLNTGSTSEDSPQAVTGRLTIADVDDGQAHFVAQNAAGSYGSLTLTEDGQWSYQLDNSKAAVQALKTGDSVTDTFTVTSADGTTHQVSVTVTGKDDGAVIAGTDTGTVAEDQSVQSGHLETSGRLSVTDPDAGQDHFLAQTNVAGSVGLGHFSLNSTGAWIYTADNSQTAIQHLKSGESLTDTLTVNSVDGTIHTITVTLQGTNDVPVLQAQTQAVTEDGAQLTGKMIATDVDAGDTQTFSIAQPVDGFTLNADGSYSFDPSHVSYQHLAAGQTQAILIPITVTDRDGATSTQNLTITVTGTNDGAQISGTDSGVVTEDLNTSHSNLLVSGQLHVSDRDTGENLFVVTGQSNHQPGIHERATPVAGDHGLGQFVVHADGTWTFMADNTKPQIQTLAEHQTLQETITVHTIDGTTHTLTVTIQGTNDAPLLAAQTQAITEDGAQLSGHMVATDVDAGDTQTFSIAQAVDGFTLNANGSYSFDPSHASYQHLTAGQTQAIVIPITVTDSASATSTQNLSITVTGSNDGPTIAGVNTGSTAEDSSQAVTGQLTIADLDDGQAHFVAQNAAAGSYGSLTLAEDGQWSYQLDNSKAAVQALKTGQTVTDSFTFTTADGTTHTVSVTVAGRDDGAVIAGTDTGTVTEDTAVTTGHLQASGQLTVSDADTGEAHFTAQTDVAGSAGYGHFSVDASGAWTYSADNTQTAVQQLKSGESLTDTLTVASADGTTHTITVTLNGTNDAPVLVAQSQAVTEDGRLLRGQMVATDADAGDTKTFSLANAVDGFTLNADGSYSFDPSHASYQHLAAGQTQDVVIPITVTDSTGLSSTQNLTITVTGSNDGPLVVVDTAAKAVDAGTINEDAPHVFSEADLLRLVGASDVDDGAQLHIVAGSLTSAHGTFTGDAAHGFTFIPAANYSGQDVDLKFSVTDGTANREAFATLDITPVADAPDRLAGKPLSSNFDDAAGAAGWQPKAGRALDLQWGSPVGGQAVVLTDRASDQLHQDLDTFAGQRVHLSFDVMATNHISVPLQVLWEGKVVANTNPKFAYWESTHTELDLVATGPNSRLEFRTDGDYYTDGRQVRLDNVNLRFDDIRSDRLAVTNHDLQLQLGSEFRPTDSDGSESLHYLIKGLPVGFTLTDGTHSVTVGQADQEIDTRGWQQDALRVQAPHDYIGSVDIRVTARSEEAGNQQTADAPLLPMRLSFESNDALTVSEDTPKTFSADKLLALAGVVAPPGEHLSLSDVTVDPAFGHLTHNSNGSWTFTPAANVSADQVPLTLTVAGGTQPVTASLALSIAPVVDAPVSGGGLTVSTDFDHQGVGGDGWAFVDGTGMGWHTDYAKGIQVGQDKLYGGSSTNQIVELAANAGNNIYRDLPTTAGQALHFGFDLSARAGNTVAALEVLWEGKVIDTITPSSAFGLEHHEYDLVATGANSRIELRATGGDGRSIIDNIAISPPPVVGLVNHAVSLDVSQAFHLADTDGSETISYLIEDLPVGATLSDGSHSVTVAAAGEAIDIKGWQLDTLTLQAPKDFEGQLDFKISATAEEGATHETAMSTEQAMRLTFEHLETAEDTPRTFSESELLHLAGIRAPAGQTYALGDVQVDPAFGHVTHDADGKWTFTPAANVSADQVPLTLTVTGGAQPITATLPLNITPVVDAPVREATTGGSGQAISTDFNSVAVGGDGWAYVDGADTGWHTDYAKGIQVGQDKLYGGSSTNQIVELNAGAGNNIYRELPTTAGQTLHFGFDLSARGGSSVATLEVVWEGKVIDTITPASGFALVHHAYDLLATGANSRLELRATGGGEGRAIIDNIDIGAPVDPLLAPVNHDLHLNLTHELHLADTDGSETLTYIVKGLPVGFTLTDGTHSATVTTAGQVIETAGWDQDALMVRAPQDYAGQLAIQVSARAEETGNHQTATSADMTVSLSFENPSTAEDTPKTFTAPQLMQLAGISVPDGQTYTVDDVQVDPAFGQVSHDADGKWTFTPAANVSADAVSLTVHVSGGAQPLSGSFPLNITPVVDAPVLEAGSGPQYFDLAANFDTISMGSAGWATTDPAVAGWHTDHSGGVEMATEKVYGGTNTNSVAVGLIANAGANLFREVPTQAGQTVHLSFDLSARPSFAKSPVDVVWEGKVIDTITPSADGFAMVRHDYDLVATGSNSRIELRASGSGDQRALIDNLEVVGLPPAQFVLSNHDYQLDLTHSLHLADTDGSETLTYLVKGLPVGFTLTDGTHSATVATAGQVIETTGWTLDALMVRPSQNFHGDINLQVSARAEETANHQTATSADMALRLSFDSLSTAEDTPRTFSEVQLLQFAGLRAPAGQTYTLGDVQVDPAFGQVTHNADGSWTFTPAANVSADQVALNLTVTGGAQPQQVALPLQITAVTDAPLQGAGVSNSDFEQQRVTDSSSSQFLDPGKYGWHSDGAGGVEVGPETSFGGSRSGNQVLELISKGASGAKVPNLYRDLTTEPGQHLHFAFDLSRRAGWAVGPVEVLWEGKVIDTITPTDGSFALHHHAYDLVATGSSARLELRVLGDTVDQRALLDNLYVGPPPQMALVNHDLHLKVDDYVRLADTDGSETLNLLIKGLPVGFTLTDGSHSVTVTAADQVIDTKGWQQDALSIQSPQDFSGTLDLSISGRSEEGSTHQTATTAELPVRLSFERLGTTEDTPLTLDEDKLLALAGVVPAAGQHLSLSDVQVDPAFGQFSHNADGSWTFTPSIDVHADQVPFNLIITGGAQPRSCSLLLSIISANVNPAPAPAILSDGQETDLAEMRPNQLSQVNIEVTPADEHHDQQQLVPVLSEMTPSAHDSDGQNTDGEQPIVIAPHVADYWQFADLSGVVQGDKSDGHPFADQVSGYLDAAGIHVEEGAQVMPPMPPVEALMEQHVNGSNDEHHMTSLDESVTGSETGEPLLAPEDPSHQHHG